MVDKDRPGFITQRTDIPRWAITFKLVKSIDIPDIRFLFLILANFTSSTGIKTDPVLKHRHQTYVKFKRGTIYVYGISWFVLRILLSAVRRLQRSPEVFLRVFILKQGQTVRKGKGGRQTGRKTKTE